MFLTKWFFGIFPKKTKKSITNQKLKASFKDINEQRAVSRDQLYIAIRESMASAGVLSSSYKFKVLSVDSANQTFVVMVDLSCEPGRAPPRTSQFEAAMVQRARSVHGLFITGVYWRVSEVSLPGRTPMPAHAPVKPATGVGQAVEAQEVDAFHRALRAAAVPPPAKPASEPATAAKSGFKDVPFDLDDEPHARRHPVLSATQYGDLN